MSVPRPEHPRPQFYRAAWQSLNGTWGFAVDPGDSGLNRGWAKDASHFTARINVPFCPESAMSGIENRDFMNVVWYQREFEVPNEWRKAKQDSRVLLQFGAVDWSCRVWVNGEEVGEHRGGGSSFALDITDALNGGTNQLVIRVEDDIRSGLQPAGKQSLRHQSFAASYTRTTGIWQSVWLESVPATRIDSVQIIPDWSQDRFVIVPRYVALNRANKIRCIASSNGQEVARVEQLAGDALPIILNLPDARAWSPDDPHLYELHFELLSQSEEDNATAEAASLDSVTSYAGLRQFTAVGDRFFLNGKPIFLRLVLDQGFYPQSLWTAPTDQALREDIELSKNLGFNGARLHQKVFEERFHYWADQLGYLTWGEFSDWGLEGMNFFPPRQDAVFQQRALDNHLREWCEVVERDRNHPSIILWTPFNEAIRRKGRERSYDAAVKKIYALTKVLDPTRPVHDASGWTHVQTDVYSVHDYEQDPEIFYQTYANGPCDRGEVREQFGGEPGVAYNGQPYMVDEYGGTWWKDGADQDSSWGYGERPNSSEAAITRIIDLTKVLLDNPKVAGFCYTQLTDIEQEQNGLYTDNRELKFDQPRLFNAFSAPAAIETREPD